MHPRNRTAVETLLSRGDAVQSPAHGADASTTMPNECCERRLRDLAAPHPGPANAWCYPCGISHGTARDRDAVPARTQCSCGHQLCIRPGNEEGARSEAVSAAGGATKTRRRYSVRLGTHTDPYHAPFQFPNYSPERSTLGHVAWWMVGLGAALFSLGCGIAAAASVIQLTDNALIALVGWAVGYVVTVSVYRATEQPVEQILQAIDPPGEPTHPSEP